MPLRRWSAVLTFLAGTSLHLNRASAAEAVQFNRDVRPILSENCFACHGADKNNLKGKRRLDSFEGATAERNDIRAIVPGDPANSDLWLRVLSEDDEERMPPRDSHKTLTSVQKETLKRWIAEGANYQTHWAYVAPSRPAPPAVKMGAWPRSDLDRFVLANLEKQMLTPAPEANRTTLIRRLALDLTGLPPTPAQVGAFLADTSSDAYERVVDRLLQSPHYGERMAVDWLDAARYADTNGYQVDRDREIWAWRDWVIQAFNDNKRFDQFTIEQLAGDLLPQPTLAQRIATGFNRNHMINEEGGIIPEEFLAEYASDRVETTAAVWLGQTFTCNRCHDHKFDPFTQKDYYSLKAFFHNVPELGKSIRQNDFRFNSPPFVTLPSAEIDAKLSSLRAKQKSKKSELTALRSTEDAHFTKWRERLARERVEWTPLKPLAAYAEDQKPEVEASTQSVIFEYLNNTRMDTTVRTRAHHGKITALRITCEATDIAGTFNLTEVGLKLKRGAGAPVELQVRPADEGDSLGRDAAELVHDGSRETRVPLKATSQHPRSLVFEFKEPPDLTDESAELIFVVGSYGASSPTRWRFEATSSAVELLVPSSLSRAAAAPEEKDAHASLNARFALQQPSGRALEDELTTLHRQIVATERDYSTTMVMEEMEKPRDTFILIRGAYDKPGERVTAATPAVLPPLSADLPRNRLGLARWLVDPANPLTARVTVNRFWQCVFGVGLVKTSEDFGSQGEPPVDPDLLDWLATEFIRSGWDVKAMMRLIVTSATYRQASRVTPELRERDPENRLLARGPRFRLTGEFIRDQALAVSGLLLPTIGGPSVRPYHPPGLYEGVAPTSEDTVKTYVQGRGDDLHRRSLYTYWKRSVPHPAMLAFDVPFREVCTVKRPRTNTPAQALNLMNDPTYVEAARFVAQRILREGGASADERLVFAHRLVLSRDPEEARLAVLRRALARVLKDFAGDPAAADAFIRFGDTRSDAGFPPAELAAYTAIASTLLCMDETVTKQ